MSSQEETRKRDFSDELKIAIPESIALAESSGLEEATSLLFALEKKCRLNNDTISLKEVCLQIIRLCRQKFAWEKLNSVLTVISKRRAQSKTAVTAIVEESMTYIDQTPDKATKVELIKTLKDICEGKMYVEGECARLHLMLAMIFEADGNIGEACDMIQDVHVETYGSLSKKEKAEYILQQIRLNLLRKDFVRALIQVRVLTLDLLFYYCFTV